MQELQVGLRQANEALTAKNHDLVQLNRENGQWLERHTRLEKEVAQLRQTIQTQQGELDTLRLTAAEHQALQVRWGQDAQSLDTARQDLAQARTELAQERERREQAEAETLRATVRLSTLEPLLAQLQPASAGGKGAKRISSEETPAP